jgi:hypothetical protein
MILQQMVHKRHIALHRDDAPANTAMAFPLLT